MQNREQCRKNDGKENSSTRLMEMESSGIFMENTEQVPLRWK